MLHSGGVDGAMIVYFREYDNGEEKVGEYGHAGVGIALDGEFLFDFGK